MEYVIVQTEVAATTAVVIEVICPAVTVTPIVVVFIVAATT